MSLKYCSHCGGPLVSATEYEEAEKKYVERPYVCMKCKLSYIEMHFENTPQMITVYPYNDSCVIAPPPQEKR